MKLSTGTVGTALGDTLGCALAAGDPVGWAEAPGTVVGTIEPTGNTSSDGSEVELVGLSVNEGEMGTLGS